MALRRECRGLVFDQNGQIISRRLHKFFNVMEKLETQIENINFDCSHVILEKLDGSMITPIPIDGNIRWGTKMGITDVSMNAEVFVVNNSGYIDFAEYCINIGVTPIFEWCSRKNRIVVDYPQDRLVLIAVRDNSTGKYSSYEEMVKYATDYNLDLVKVYPGNVNSLNHLMDETRGAEGIEGWVLRFDDGHMVKIKGEWYVKIHKNKDNLNYEKRLIDLIINNKVDDIKPFLLKEDKEKVENFEKDFWHGFESKRKELEIALGEYTKSYDRKSFATEVAPNLDVMIKSIMFACWDGKNSIEQMMLNTIQRNLSTQEKLNAVRVLWGDLKWEYSSND